MEYDCAAESSCGIGGLGGREDGDGKADDAASLADPAGKSVLMAFGSLLVLGSEGWEVKSATSCLMSDGEPFASPLVGSNGVAVDSDCCTLGAAPVSVVLALAGAAFSRAGTGVLGSWAAADWAAAWAVGSLALAISCCDGRASLAPEEATAGAPFAAFCKDVEGASG